MRLKNSVCLGLLSLFCLLAHNVSAEIILLDYGNSAAAAPTLGGDWNVVNSNAGQALVDSTGAASGVSISFGGDAMIVSGNDQGSWSHGDSGWVDALATNDYIFNVAGDASTITFTGLIAGASYTFDHLAVRELGPGRIADYTIGGSFADSTPNGQAFDHLDDGWTPGNWLTWNDVVADGAGSFTLTIDNVIGFGYISGSRISLNTAIPEPTSFVFLSIGLGLVAARRRKR